MNQDELLALIDQIYGAAADIDRWPVVLQTIADAFDAGDASLSAVSQRDVPWLVAPRTDPAFLQSYGAYYHPLNLFWQRAASLPVGTVVTDRMVLPKETLHASPFFNEWSRPQGYLSVMGATLLADDDWRVEFVVPGKHEFGPEHLKLYEAIAPHLKRAVQLNHRLQTLALDRHYSFAALDSIGQGVLVVDFQGARPVCQPGLRRRVRRWPAARRRRALRRLLGRDRPFASGDCGQRAGGRKRHA